MTEKEPTTTITISKAVMADFRVAYAEHCRRTGQSPTLKSHMEFMLRQWINNPVFQMETQPNGAHQQ